MNEFNRPLPRPFERWRHFKKKEYQIIGIAQKRERTTTLQKELYCCPIHSETMKKLSCYQQDGELILEGCDEQDAGERFVIYQALYGDYGIYARELSMFLSETDHRKYPDVSQRWRFECIKKIEL